MIKQHLAAVTVVAGVLFLGGCGDVRESLGLIHNPPDEFRVVSHEPLVVPESLDHLPPPAPGTSRPQESQPQVSAEEQLLGQALETPDASTAEVVLMALGGADEVEPAIRSLIDSEHQAILANVSWLDEINPIREAGDPTAVLIDPEKESRRLQAIAALGLPINSGDFSESILEEQGKALLEGLL